MIGAARFLPLTSVDADALGAAAGLALSLGFANDGAGADVDAIGGGEGSTLKRDARADSEGIVVQLSRSGRRESVLFGRPPTRAGEQSTVSAQARCTSRASAPSRRRSAIEKRLGTYAASIWSGRLSVLLEGSR